MQPPALIGSLGGDVPDIHPQAWVAPGAVLVGKVTLGRASSVWYGSVLRADDAEIIVGAECNIQDLCCLHVDAGQPAVLEDRVSLGHRAMVHGAHIGEGALIGVGAIVLGGAKVGAGSLVAAGAVVLSGAVLPAGVLAAGVPSRIVRELTEADRQAFAHTAANYVQRASRHQNAAWL
jgi:carbonic anhydrase/acetyltransferase-like protein (isoleucine patch superfamily)